MGVPMLLAAFVMHFTCEDMYVDIAELKAGWVMLTELSNTGRYWICKLYMCYIVKSFK